MPVAAAGQDTHGDDRFSAATWKPPAESQIPNDSLGVSIRRGLALVTYTNDSLPRFAPGMLPGVITVPAMVVAFTQMQERGVAYVYAG